VRRRAIPDARSMRHSLIASGARFAVSYGSLRFALDSRLVRRRSRTEERVHSLLLTRRRAKRGARSMQHGLVTDARFEASSASGGFLRAGAGEEAAESDR
jgi:hypothetical protein